MPFYNIVATMPADSPNGRWKLFVVERFQLVFHDEEGRFPWSRIRGDPSSKERHGGSSELSF
jgi:hypothetical protein